MNENIFNDRKIPVLSKSVFPIALGCMGLAEFYGTINNQQSIATIKIALERGINLLDTADMYGNGLSETLIAKAMAMFKRADILISSKVGFVRSDKDINHMQLNGDPDYIKKACDKSLQRLGTDYIDIYFLHRIDPNYPLQITLEAFIDLKKQGKIKSIGLSDTTLSQLQLATQIVEIAAYQSEYSIWHRDPEINGILELCQDHNISFMPYCPLGRGILAGELMQYADLANKDDVRKTFPRFYEENFPKNLKLIKKLQAFANMKSLTLAQVSLAWLLNKNKNIIPIAGMKAPKHVLENLISVNIFFSQKDMQELESIMPQGCAHGEQYPDTMDVH